MFGADEVLTVLRGRMVLANPETGEVQLVESRSSSVAFGQDTWHHAFAHGTERVASARAVRATAVDRDVRAVRADPAVPRRSSSYADDSVIGNWPAAADERARDSSLRLIDPTRDPLPARRATR